MYVLLDNVGLGVYLFLRYDLEALLGVAEQIDAVALAAVVRLQYERGQYLLRLELLLVYVPTVGAKLFELLRQEPSARIEVELIAEYLPHYIQRQCERSLTQHHIHCFNCQRLILKRINARKKQSVENFTWKFVDLCGGGVGIGLIVLILFILIAVCRLPNDVTILIAQTVRTLLPVKLFDAVLEHLNVGARSQRVHCDRGLRLH